jgi:hypothetical protein
MREIQLTKGMVALVDDEDFAHLSQFKWQAHRKGGKTYYAKTDIGRRSVGMHQMVMDAGDLEVDHRDGNGLDNRRSNLRLATHSQNQCNRGLQRNSTSGFTGVSWRKDIGSWQAYVNFEGKRKNLGCFTDPIDAARAYNDAALDLHGEFAVLNEV